jgi:predicted DNA-binding protein (MmcQ/YjbR family)
MNIESLQKICQALPAVTEDIKWDNDLVFSVGGKMFCVAALDAPFKCSFKVSDEEFEELSVLEGFQPAPYMARAKWVMVTMLQKMNRQEWERRIKESHSLVKSKLTKKLRSELGID